jgi:hypothetical protein
MFEIETELRARIDAQRQAIEAARRENLRLHEENEWLRARLAGESLEPADLYVLAPTA